MPLTSKIGDQPKAVLHKVEEEPLFREEKEQRARLIDELEEFLKQIKAFVNLE